jgi:large subunit ribosomal protein L25
MKSVTINATEREDLGSKFARKLRKEGSVPCVMYGGDNPIHFYADTLQFRDLVYTAEARKAEINLGKNKVEAVVQDIQFHPVTDQIMHIDFMQLIDGKPVSVDVPVNLNGMARGVRNGGRLKHVLRKLTVRALPGELPSAIDIDVTELRIGQSIRVDDVKKTGNFEFLQADGAAICSIKMARGAFEDEEDEEGEEGEGEEGAESESEGGDAAESKAEE